MSDYEPLARLFGVDDATATAMREEYAALNIEWHCPGRHGVVRDVPRQQAGRVQRVIEWHQGAKACRWTQSLGGKQSVEFVAMSKVFPPPKTPWGWCGTTILFTDWQEQEKADRVALETFYPGQPVWFAHKGDLKVGEVSKVNRKTVSVHVTGEGLWTVPPRELTAFNA